MHRPLLRFAFAALVAFGLAAPAALAQPVTLPPSGDNQYASVTQGIGPVRVTIAYNSPDVTSPNGEDRTGKIWGQLVPFGLVNLGFGTCGDACPWRGGANENTTFTVSHDVLVEGEPLAAGTYGLHFIPTEDEWTVIFSNNATSWGSYFYDENEDVLRVTVTPEEAPFHEWLTYRFVDREPDQATVALMWENLSVPWTISVPSIEDLYVSTIRDELRSSAGFSWQGWQAAAQYTLQTGTHLDEGLQWAQNAVSAPFIGQENFTTLSTLARLQAANGQTDEAEATLARAVEHPTATVFSIHQLGRQLIAQEESERALAVFEMNAERHPDVWPVHVGLARGYAATGDTAKALEHARLALEQAPDDPNRQNLQSMIERLEAGQAIN